MDEYSYKTSRPVFITLYFEARGSYSKVLPYQLRFRSIIHRASSSIIIDHVYVVRISAKLMLKI